MTVYNITSFGAVADGVTDCSPAFVAAGNAMFADPGSDLILPSGTLLLVSNASASGRFIGGWAAGVTGRVIGAGSGSTTFAMADKCNVLAGIGQIHDGSHWGAINSVSAGSLTATLKSIGDASKFSINQWVLITGLNQQDIYSDVPNTGFGYPPNLTFFEYVQISNISGAVLTFSTALQQSYLDTWPSLNTGNAFEINAGGPAGIYSLDSNWGQQIEFQGITFTTTSGNQIYGGCRSIIYRDCVFPGASAPIPSQNQTFAIYNSTNAVDTEVDKLNTNFIMDGCTWNRLTFQSASVTNFTLNNTTISSGLNGSGMTSNITNSTLSSCQPGANSYGVSPGIFSISNTAVNNWNLGGNQFPCECISTMSAGVIALPNGTSVSNITDNGSGKARYTVTSSAGFTAGKFIPTGNPTQELTTTATTSIGGNTVTFGGGVPAWMVAGQPLRYSTNTTFPAGTTIVSATATTITFSSTATAAVAIGDKFGIRSTALSSDQFSYPSTPPGAQILTIVNGTTIDFNQTFPSGFVYANGSGLNMGTAYGWARPGSYIYWYGTSGYSGKFKVLGVTQDANKTYVQTDQPGGFPTIPKGANGAGLLTPGAQRVRASALTGTSILNAVVTASQSFDKPLGSYANTVYTGSNSSVATTAGTRVMGNLVSMTIDVTQAYTGSLFSTLFLHPAQFDNLVLIVDGTATSFGWGVDLKTVGKRIILPTNTATNPTKQANDSNLLVPAWSTSLWLNDTPAYNLQTVATASGTTRNISSEASNLWPIVTAEIQTDQGFFFANLSFPLFGNLRFHA